jgi:hypothetical protein
MKTIALLLLTGLLMACHHDKPANTPANNPPPPAPAPVGPPP